MNASDASETLHVRHIVAAARLKNASLFLGERVDATTYSALLQERSRTLFETCSAVPRRVEPARFVTGWCS